MKRMTDKTKKIIFWTLYGCTVLILIVAFTTGMIGIRGSNSSLVRISNILVPCGLLLSVIDVFAFKPNGKKSKKSDKS